MSLKEPRYSLGKEDDIFFPEEQESSIVLAYVEQLLCADVGLLMPVEVQRELCMITNVINVFKMLEQDLSRIPER